MCLNLVLVIFSAALLGASGESPERENVQSFLDDDPLTQRKRAEISEYMKTLGNAQDDWEDPFEMFNFPNEEKRKDSAASHYVNSAINQQYFADKVDGGSHITDNELTADLRNQEQSCMSQSVFLSRWLKKLVLKLEDGSDLDPSSVTFSLDSDSLSTLKDFAAADFLDLSHIDEILSNLLALAAVNRKEQLNISHAFEIVKIYNFPIILILTVAISAYVLHQCFQRKPYLTTLLLIIVISIFWHWMHLYKQKQASKHAQLHSIKIPDECRKVEFGLSEHLYEYVKSYFSKDECSKYYEALMVDPFWEVSITVAISEAVTSTLFQPLNIITKMLNSSVKQLFDGLSYFTIVYLSMFIFLVLIIISNYRIKLPFFLGALEPHIPPATSSVEDVRPSKTFNSLKGLFCHHNLNNEQQPQAINCSGDQLKAVSGCSSLPDSNMKMMLKNHFECCSQSMKSLENLSEEQGPRATNCSRSEHKAISGHTSLQDSNLKLKNQHESCSQSKKPSNEIPRRIDKMVKAAANEFDKNEEISQSETNCRIEAVCSSDSDSHLEKGLKDLQLSDNEDSYLQSSLKHS